MTRGWPITGACAALAGALLLSSCGEGPATQITGLVTDRFKSGAERRKPTREELNAAPYAIIAVKREGASKPAYLSAISENDGYVTYQSPAGRSFTFRGGAIAGHRGLGYDLMGFNSSTNDPLVSATPLDKWPESVDRVYQMRGGDGRIYTRSAVCTPIRGDAMKVEIVEIVFDLVQVEDRCRNGAMTFSNWYWVAADTGFVWKSVQWTGPEMYPLIVEIIKPYASAG